MKQRKNVVDLVKVAFIALLIKVMASSSLIMPWNPIADNLCILFAIFVLLIKLSRLTLPLGKAIFLGVISLFTLYTCITVRQYDLLVTLITIFLLINVDLDAYISLMYKIQIFILIAHLAVSCVWSAVGGYSLFWKLIDVRLRFNGGFVHPNVLSCYIMSCMLMFTWMHFKRITANGFACMAIITALTYLMTRSRTGLLLNVTLLLTVILSQSKQPSVVKALSRMLMPMFLVLLAVVHWAQRNFLAENPLVLFLNKLLNGRLKYAAYAYTQSGVTWLPRYLDYAAENNVPWSSEWRLTTFTFDNIYSFFIVQMGIVWVGLLTVIIAIVCRKSDYKVKIFFLIWVLFAMVEVHGLNCYKLFVPILLCTLISKKGGKDYPTSKN